MARVGFLAMRAPTTRSRFRVHFNAVISQFRLNTSLTADFCYLTKSSTTWNLVLVELEPPTVPLFLEGKRQVTQTAEFTQRLAQIQTWRDAVAAQDREIIR